MIRLVELVNEQLRLVADHDRQHPWSQQITGGYGFGLLVMLLLTAFLLSW